MYGADSQRRTWPLWTYCWGKHTAVGRGVQPTSCNLLAGCSKCSGKLGYTSTQHKELLTERRASYPASYTEAKQIHHVWPLYHRFFQTSGWIKFSTWTVVFRTASRGSVWLQIALRCNSLVEQHVFFFVWEAVDEILTGFITKQSLTLYSVLSSVRWTRDNCHRHRKYYEEGCYATQTLC